MPDIAHLWGNDLRLSPSGDLGLVDGTQVGVERVLRRLMTAGNRIDYNGANAPGEYIFHLEYGGSVPERIGDTINTDIVNAVICQQMALEAAVAQSPPPVVSISADFETVIAEIQYVDATTGEQNALTFDLKV